MESCEADDEDDLPPVTWRAKGKVLRQKLVRGQFLEGMISVVVVVAVADVAAVDVV